MFPEALLKQADVVLQACRAKGLKLATAESCTGGLIAALLTEIAGASDVVDRGFVVYSNAAKTEMLGVPADLIERFGAVSEDVARAMVQGALRNSEADMALACTGIASPGGGTESKPVGLVYVALMVNHGPETVKRCDFGEIGRSSVRLETMKVALDLVSRTLTAPEHQ